MIECDIELLIIIVTPRNPETNGLVEIKTHSCFHIMGCPNIGDEANYYLLTICHGKSLYSNYNLKDL